MLRVLPRSQGNVVGIECSGAITVKDYQEIIIQNINRVIAEHGKSRVLLDFATDYAGYGKGALIMDLKYTFKHKDHFEKLAVINAPLWVTAVVAIFDKMTKCKSRSFKKEHREDAWDWIEE